MSKIVITGATGKLGNLVVDHLLKQKSASEIAVSVRDIQKADAIAGKGVEVRYGDYDDPASLKQAFVDASQLLLISSAGGTAISRIRQHIQAIEAAKQAGVKHILYTSFAATDKGAFPLLGNVHAATEYALLASDLPYTILRNAFYQDSYVNATLGSYVQSGSIITSAGEGRINTVERNDLALAIANVLATEGHENRVYELASSEAWNYDELAAILTDVSGAKVVHRSVSDREATASLVRSGMSEAAANFQVLRFRSIAEGKEGSTSTDLERLLGRKPVTMRESISNLFTQN